MQTIRARVQMIPARVQTIRARVQMIPARVVTIRARVVTIRARVVTIRARVQMIPARVQTILVHVQTIRADLRAGVDEEFSMARSNPCSRLPHGVGLVLALARKIVESKPNHDESPGMEEFLAFRVFDLMYAVRHEGVSNPPRNPSWRH